MGEHCSTCVCGMRASVQECTRRGIGPGTIDWTEHERAWAIYAARYGRDQSAQRIHARGGFSYGELVTFLGYEPKTWAPAGAVAERERHG